MKDLTKGNPFKIILLFLLPVLAGSLFQQLYSMADTIIVGRTINADALTGVALTGSANLLVLGFACGLVGGFSVRVSQRFGAGDEEGVRRSTGMSYLLCIILSVVMTAIAVPLTGPVLRLMNTPSEYYEYAYWYLLTVFGGIFATVLYNMTAVILRAIGDSKTPLVFLIVTVVLNIGLDFAFILGLKMNYLGAGLATVISQLVSGVLSTVYMFVHYPKLRLKRSDFKWNTRLAWQHIYIGLPMAVLFSISSVGTMVQQTALNKISVDYPGVLTGFVAASKIDNLANQIFGALAIATTTYVGQNYGAGRYDRIRKGTLAAMVYVLAGTAVGFAFCMGLYYPLMRLFIDPSKTGAAEFDFEEVLAYGRVYLLIENAFYVFLGAMNVLRNVFQGMGRSVIAMAAGLIEVVGRTAMSFVFIHFWGLTGFYFINPFALTCSVLFLTIAYFVVLRGKGRKGENETGENAEGDPEQPPSEADAA